MNNIKISVIITCGGSSTRFGSNKLLEKIDDLTVIETTISKFIDLADEIIIPSTNETKEFIEKSKLFNNKIKFALNGLTRQMSVYNGLQVCSNSDIVLIHDGARPFIEKETIVEAIKKTQKYKATVVGYMAIDTIKKVDKHGKIVETLDRNEIFHAQTPQSFDFQLIKNIHEKFKDNPNYTDDASMAEACGIDVYCVLGSKNNKKITNREDLLKI